MSTPALRFAEFKGDWHVFSLGDGIEEIAMGPFGSNLKVDMFTTKGVPIIKGGNLLTAYVRGPYSFVSEEKASSLGKSVAYPGDFIVTHRGTLGQVSIIKEGQYKRFVTSQSQLRFRTNKDKFVDEWLNQYLHSTKGNRRMLVDAGQVGVPAISVPTTSLRSVLVVAPTLSEQRKIADFLAMTDMRVSGLEKKILLLKKYKKSTMQRIFSQQIRFKDKGGKYPDWHSKILEDVYSFVRTNSLSRDALSGGEGIKNIHYGDIHKLLPSQLDVSDYDLPRITDISIKFGAQDFCRVGDIVMADASEDYKDIGKCIEVKSTALNEAVAGLHTILLRSIDSVEDGFGGYLLRSGYLREQIIKIATGVSVLGISKGNLSKIKLRMPTGPEQRKIADFLSTIDSKISLEESRLGIAKSFQRTLRQKMFV